MDPTKRILELAAQGLTDTEIAGKLGGEGFTNAQSKPFNANACGPGDSGLKRWPLRAHLHQTLPTFLISSYLRMRRLIFPNDLTKLPLFLIGLVFLTPCGKRYAT